MAKRFTLALIDILAGIAGNLIAGAIQQDMLNNAFTLERMLGFAAGVILMSLLLAWLESERALPRNWWWHKYWFLRGLLQDQKLKDWERNFARLDLAKRQGKNFALTEVLESGQRRDLVQTLKGLVKESDYSRRRALVLGEPGSGKTTGLEGLTIDLAKRGTRRLGASPLPVFVPLGEYQRGELLEFIARRVMHTVAGKSSRILSKDLLDLLEQGQIALLLDALDEALGERRDNVLSEVRELLASKRYTKTPIIITSRTKASPAARFIDLQTFDMQDLSDEAVDIFIRAYKKPIYDVAEIKARLNKYDLLRQGGIGRNPFWLRNIVEQGVFDGNRSHILDKTINYLLDHEWSEKARTERSWRRVLPQDDQFRETKLGLAWLAYSLTREGQSSTSQEQALAVLDRWLKNRIGIQQLTAQDILGLGKDAQLLDYQEPVRFRHKLLQEFLAAWMIYTDKQLRSEKLLAQYARETTWWETLFLLGGLINKLGPLDDYDELVKHVLGRRPTLVRLFAATGLLYSAVEPPDTVVEAITKAASSLIGEAISSDEERMIQEYGRSLGGDAAEAFNVLYRHHDQQAKSVGANLLCALDDNRAVELLISGLQNEYQRDALADILARIGVPAIKPLIVALNHSDDYVREYAAAVLGRVGEPALTPLVAAWESPTLRWSIVPALKSIGGQQSIRMLVDAALSDPDARVRGRAAESLGEMRNPATVSALLAALHEQTTWVHVNAVGALEKMGAYVAEQLIELLDDSEPIVRGSVAQILGNIGGSNALPALDRLAESDKGVDLWGDNVAAIAAQAAEKIRRRERP